MLQIERFVVNMIEENCYFLYDESGEAVIVDCGAWRPEEKEAMAAFVREKGLRPRYLLNTHCHFDHVFGDAFVQETYGLLPRMHRAEVPVYEGVQEQMQLFLHRHLSVSLPPAGELFGEGDILRFGHHALQVIHTPGHTPGGVCFYCEEEKVLLSGDSLFRREIGRCDLPGGDYAALIASLRDKVLTLPADVRVLPGHGEATTVGEERLYNRYLGSDC